MANILRQYTASSGLPSGNISGLTSSTTHTNLWSSHEIFNESGLLDYLVSARIQASGAGLTAGEIRAWIITKMSDVMWPGSIDGIEGKKTAPLDDENGTNAGARIGSIATTDTSASQVYYLAPFSVASLFGGVCPERFVVAITQSTVANLPPTGHNVTIKGTFLSSN